VLGDVIAAVSPARARDQTVVGPVAAAVSVPIVDDVVCAFYLQMEVADRPGALAQVAQRLGEQGASIRSVVQRGLGENAQLVMVTHPLLESRLATAIEQIGELESIRSRPRAIRVIDEEFE
jgi:homoserine dehydrogenase